MDNQAEWEWPRDVSLVIVIKRTLKRFIRIAGWASQPIAARWAGHGCVGEMAHLLSEQGRHIFFGYYDHSPFSFDETLVLAHRSAEGLKTPAPESVIELGYFDLNEGESPHFNKIDETSAWCWQQGARLHWYPRNRPTSTVIFNAVKNGRYIAKIVSFQTGSVSRTLPAALYDVSHCGRFGLSLNFSRLQRLRPGYGYTSLPDETLHERIPSGDGVFLFDFDSDTFRLQVSIDQLASCGDLPAGCDTWEHYVNHLSFSPDGSRFLVLHLLASVKGRLSRLFICDRKSGKLRLVNGSGRVSHFAWDGDESLLVFCAEAGDSMMKYRRYNLSDMTSEEILPSVTRDGHPTVCFEGHVIATDTYPNRLGYQSILYYDAASGDRIGRHLQYRDSRFVGEVRTDLHPRPSRSGRLLCVDDEKAGYKAIKVFPVTYGR